MFKVRSVSLDFGRVSKEPIDFLRANGCEFETVQMSDTSEEKMREVIADVDALVVGLQGVTEKVLGFPHRLKVIGRHGAGLDNIDLKAAGLRHIPVVYAPGANAHSVADLVIGLILSLARKIPYADRTTKNCEWKRVVGNEIWGKTLGIFGLGSIGFKVAHRARGFNMKVIGYDVIQNESMAREYGVTYRTKAEILAEADFITLHLPYLPETIGFISDAELTAMKKTALLINTSRGKIVDEQALCRALKEGRIAGAALDVFEKEPPDRSPLFDLDQFIASPHMAGVTQEAVGRTGMAVAQDIVAVLNGRQPEFLANRAFLK